MITVDPWLLVTVALVCFFLGTIFGVYLFRSRSS